MDEQLFNYGLSYSTELDKKFNKTTIAAKMTDVPGHTIGIVPLMAKRGIKYLHIGVNGGSCVPDVPRVFKWRHHDGSEIIVQYDGSYGETLLIPGMDEALVIVNAGDNCGAPDVDSVLHTFDELTHRFPGAQIRASTMDAFVPALSRAQGIPVITEEIGDTWIHGIATDPYKTAQFKELLRLSKTWKEQDKLCDFYDELIMIPEHTWGMDIKLYLSDYTNWQIDDFHNARKADRVDFSNVYSGFLPMLNFTNEIAKNLYPDKPELRQRYSYSLFESSHCEQRAYIEKAVACLPAGLQKEAEACFQNLKPQREVEGTKNLYPGEEFTLGKFHAVIGDTGALISLQNNSDRQICGQGGIGNYSYQTFSYEDYQLYHHTYNRGIEVNDIWVRGDFGKPGMEFAKPYPRNAFYCTHIHSISLSHHDVYDEAAVLMYASAGSPRGAPRTLIIRYRGYKNAEKLELSLDWFDKEACRLPQAIWFGICLNTATPGRWRFSKLATLINPLDVVKGGNRSYHGIEYAEYRGCDAQYRIYPLDSPLATVGKRKMLEFNNRFEDPVGGIYFNIYNNIWGTNFPMWYEEDGRSRFVIELTEEKI